MQKILLLLFLFLFHGCSINTVFLNGEVNKVMVVKYAPYMKHHRAYFERSHLKTILRRKYLFLQNPKNHELNVLFRYKNEYILYNMSKPEQKPLAAHIKSNTKVKDVLKAFRHKGFKPVYSLSSIGYTTTVAKRRYKDIKTLLVETYDYSRLQSLYKKAIKNYNAKLIQNIKTKLPKPLIYAYYRRCKKHAKTKAQLEQLQIIGEKLHIEKPQKKSITPSKKISENTSKSVVKNIIKKEIKDAPKTHPLPLRSQTIEVARPTQPKIEEKQIPQVKIVKNIVPAAKPYEYYLKQSSLTELSSYLSNSTTKNTLTYNQYAALNHRKIILEEEKLFNEGTLEELIEVYKINKKPKYKKRIMLLMKEKQEAN